MRDLANNVTSIGLLAPQARGSAASGIVGSSVDTKGEARKLYALLNVGLGTNGGNATKGLATVTVEIQESTNDSTWTTLSTFDAKGDTAAVVLDLTPSKRYIRASANVIVNAAGGQTINFGVWGIFYDERQRPSNVA